VSVEAPKPITFKDFVGKQKPEAQPNRDTIYRAQDDSIALIVSSIASSHIKDGMDLLRLMDKPNFIARARRRVLLKKLKGIPKNVTKEDGVKQKLYVPLRRKHYAVAVKRFNPSSEDLTGIEQFQAMSRLQERSVLCAMPLAATEATLITKWVEPIPLTLQQMAAELPSYLEALKKVAEDLKTKGNWEENWQINENPNAYAVRNLKSKNPLWRFITINPVTTHSSLPL